VHASLEILETERQETLLRLHEVEDALRNLDLCSDSDRLLDGHPAPHPQQVEGVESLSAELATVRALKTAGRYEQALGRARRALSKARALGYEPSIASAAYESGTLHSKLGDFQGALPLLEESFSVAYSIGADRTVVDAKTALVVVEGLLLSRFDSGLAHASTARAGIERIGGDPRRSAQLESGIAGIHRARGELQRAEEGYRAALSLQERQLGKHHLEVAYTLGNLGIAVRQRGRLDEARELLERQLKILEDSVGTDHPMVGSAHINLGTVATEQGAYESADEEFRIALAVFDRSPSPRPHDQSLAWANLGNVAHLRGDTREAERLFEKAILLRRQDPLTPDPATASMQLELAELAAMRGDLATAQQRVDGALRDQVSLFGSDAPQIVDALTLRGEILLQRGQLERAQQDLERSREIQEKDTKGGTELERIDRALQQLAGKASD
jgi:tetratricopeptide (TPR) repeat protein